ncbi:ABC transporter substrate-binding protein [Pseudoclavibacter sp. RFBG4]|uniref:iron-siderophore ABC transporter substrate-binding protein n=1 Tax=unclassified Pseudoclavibacter TaxID=2615177 RepID=UPI000CE92916|nr:MULTISPECIES: iron-siderophore ABC transporter substrate-binding protein [unclassified Pseudoclavibacter]MBF4459111.1 iron-siderophore ABC transporter substrate-binding protein [Pseudoclavibacter sp. VKM Ac-2867]PPG25891.1 ABC transporter substrate-binding protein [Pseudoclavibacter sp. RFBG4]VXC27616.1 ABC transporter substrate-binding protein [Pseudoclavibacter sp. 8L]
MPRASKLVALAATALLTAGLAACSTTPSAGTNAEPGAASGDFTPITIEHALGTTEITEKPERIATVNWANQEVPLALGVVPVGMARADFGDDNGDGILPWVSEKLEELGGETPVLFDETDGVDFEAVADTNPDVILAAYSGLTQEDYDTLSEIAPVVAYPETAWATSWRDMIRLNSQGMGLEAEGDALITELEGEIEATAAKYPAIQGKKTMFLTHVDETDLSQVSFYTTHDTRSAFFEDLGMTFPQSLVDASASTDQFSQTISAEQSDTLADVEIIVTYGGEELVQTLQGDPVLSQIPAVANGSIVNLPGTEPLGTAANPTPLSISWILDDYVALLSQAAEQVK